MPNGDKSHSDDRLHNADKSHGGAKPQHNLEGGSSSNRDFDLLEQSPELASAQPGELALKAAQRETRRLARSRVENFLVASLFLPQSLRQPFYDVYAFCRTADDLADESASPEMALQQLRAFQSQLDDAFVGRPQQPLFLALSRTIEEFQLTKPPFDDLLSAFRQDQHRTRYDDFDQLLDYCCRSANPVGRIVLRLGQSYSEENAALSDQICTGLQLANFLQDIARDLAIGRVYLPDEEMRRFGVEEAMLHESSAASPLRELVASECDRAERFLRAGLPLAGNVASWLSKDIQLFAHGGLETVNAIRRVDCDVLRSRPTVSKVRQTGLVIRALLGRL